MQPDDASTAVVTEFLRVSWMRWVNLLQQPPRRLRLYHDTVFFSWWSCETRQSNDICWVANELQKASQAELITTLIVLSIKKKYNRLYRWFLFCCFSPLLQITSTFFLAIIIVFGNFNVLPLWASIVDLLWKSMSFWLITQLISCVIVFVTLTFFRGEQ